MLDSFPGEQWHFFRHFEDLLQEDRASFWRIPDSSPAGQCHCPELTDPCAPCVLRASAGTGPVFEGSRTLLCFCQACRNAL